MGHVIVCDKVCLSGAPTSLQEEKVGVVPRDRFMTIEFFGEALLLGRNGISGSWMLSAQKNAYAKMVYFGGGTSCSLCCFLVNNI